MGAADGSKHGGKAASSAGGSKTSNPRASQREFLMDDAAMQAMARELKRADTLAMEQKEKEQKKPERQSSSTGLDVKPLNAKFKPDIPKVSHDNGSDDGNSRADSKVRSRKGGRRPSFGHDEEMESRSNGGSEHRSLGRSSGRGSERKRDGSMGGDSSAPSKSLGLVEVLSETEGVCSRLRIIVQWVPIVLFHVKTLLQIQSFLSLYYLVSIPLELAFSVGSVPCLSADNWLPYSLANSSAALCDPSNADSAKVGASGCPSATHCADDVPLACVRFDCRLPCRRPGCTC